jgi:hypothetical protein
MNDFLDETNSQDYKYMMIKVPDYKGTRDDAASLVSYLRLGATPSTSDGMPEEGADLFAHAEAQLDGMPEGLFFDDERVRAGSPGATTTDERKSVSARMVEDCGWRDHSDGNRITTTRGDKIEVIRGNYKLLVLGRQDDPNEGVYLDASGGLLQTGDIAPGAISSIRWVQDPALGGTWAVLEEAEKGHVTNIYHGRVREEFYGPELTTVVGSADEGALTVQAASSDSGLTKQKPVVSETVYASSITQTTDTPTFVEKQRLGSAVSYVRAGTLAADTGDFSDTQTAAAGQLLEIKHANVLEERVLADTIKSTIGKAGKHTHIQNTAYGAMDEHWYGNFAELFIGAMESLRIAGTTMEVSASPLALEAFLGKSLQVFIGACTEITLARKMEIKTGGSEEFEIGGSTKFADFIKQNAVAIFLG